MAEEDREEGERSGKVSCVGHYIYMSIPGVKHVNTEHVLGLGEPKKNRKKK